MAEIKKINTDLQIEARLLDGDGNSGTANQVLISTGTGVDWVDGSGSSIIGGPYLPLSAGASYPLTGDLLTSGNIYLNNNKTIFGKNTSGSSYGLLTITSGNVIKLGAYAYTSAATQIGLGDNGSFLIGSSTVMKIDSSGNVGIGTTSPSEKLEVAGKLLVDNGNLGSVAGDTIYHAEITGARHHLDFKEVRTANGSDWPNTTYKLQMRVDSTNHQSIDFVSDANAQEHIDIYTGNQVFNTRFNANGNVGIGTASPQDLLHLSADSPVLRLTNTVDTGQSSIEFWDNQSGTSQAGEVFYDDNSNLFGLQGNGNGIIFRANNTFPGSELMRLNGSGNLGIGTTSPTSRLEIKATSATHKLVSINRPASDTAALYLGNDSASPANGVISSNYSDLIFGRDQSSTLSEWMRIKRDGNIGIGTTSPGATLHVESTTSDYVAKFSHTTSDGYAPGSILLQAGQANSRGQGIYHYNTVADESWFTGVPYNVNSKKWIVANQYSTTLNTSVAQLSNALLTIDSDTGNVGIGTTSPSKKLHVNGTSQFDSDVYQYGVNYGLYHGTIEDDYYFDNYNGSRYLSLFHKNAYSDMLRYQPIDNLEYWDGSAWQDMSSQAANVKKLLDGRKDTSWYVPSTYYKFRFTTSLATSWPTRSMVWLESSWTGSTYPGGTVTIEEDVSGTWTTRITADFSSSNGVTNWGLAARADSALHTGVGAGANSTRITVDFYGWSPSNPSYVTLPLQNIMITSQYSGSANTDYSALLDYDKALTAPGKLYITTTDTNTSSTSALVLNGTEVEKRTLGSAAFTNTGDYVAVAGDTMTGDLLMDGKAGVGNVIGLATGINSNAMSLKLYTYNNINPGGGLGTSTGNMIQADLGSNLVLRQTASDGDITFQSDDGSGGIATYLTLDGSSTDAYFSNPGNVGIGTTSPLGQLDVRQAQQSSPFTTPFLKLYPSTTTNLTGHTTITLGTSPVDNYGVSLSGWRYGADGDPKFRIKMHNNSASGIDALTIDSSGDVGIGTTSPNYKLEVDGTLGVSRTDGIIFAGSSGLGTGSKIVSNTSNDLIFNTALTSLPYTTTERVRILNNGNVGIGATSPADKLEVKDGSIRLNSTSSYPSTNVIKATWNGSTSPPMGSIGWEQNPGFIGSEWSHYKQTSPYTQARIRLIGDASSGGMFVNLNGSDVFTIKTSSGNVGIGTTSPNHELVVQGTSSPNIELKNSNYSNGGFILNRTNYGHQWKWWAESNVMYFGFSTDESTYSTKLAIESSGDVGIGTTNPETNLHIKGSSNSSFTGTGEHLVRIESDTTNNQYTGIGFSQASGIDIAKIAMKRTSSGSNLFFGTSNNYGNGVTNAALVIDHSGNVGMGITTPSSNMSSSKVLELSSTGNAEIVLDHIDGGTASDIGLLSFERSGDHLAHIKATHDGATDSAFISFHTQATGGSFSNAASNEKMRIKSNGNVGIGTSTPLYLLDAAGTIRCTSLIQTSQSDKKENIGNIDKSKPKAIPFKEYRYKSDIDSTGRKRYGVLAEDIENDYPELVYVDSNGDKAVNYIDLLVKRVAELEKELEDISLTPGPKGDTGATGATGPQGPAGTNGTDGKDGVNGNDHLKNVQSITFNERTGQLEITIEGYKDPFKFNPDK